MLTLSRKLNEEIVIPGLDVTITVKRIEGNVVRIGIKAPPEELILRGELVDKAPVVSVAGSLGEPLEEIDFGHVCWT